MKLVNQLLERLHSRSSTRIADGASTQNPDIAKVIHDALASAGLDRSTSRGGEIAGVIDDALTRAGLLGAKTAPAVAPTARGVALPLSIPPVEARSELPGRPRGRFLSCSFASLTGKLAYKLYVPASYDANPERAFPLLVMLHGCTQSPDDFAAGTRMNALADLHGLLVAYPAQSANANGSKCWNWFRPQDQTRGGGEPALIAGMTTQIGAEHRVDPTRIYIAGLSAGAAMAVVLGRTYPDVFVAVGAHSGLPYRAAHDTGSAFAVMRSGAAGVTEPTLQAGGKLMPTIVFHGDHDHTVAMANGDGIIAQQANAVGISAAVTTQDNGIVPGGRRYMRTTYADASGHTLLEAWRVHGGGHAWMGGSGSGSYTDPQGPDASAEMVRFFLQHAR
ncbi:MAG: PHB depolymerase family esterase [Thermomonas sp.]